MNEIIDYTPEGRNRIEIIKLHVEVAELRSRVRRWLGAIGGILGIVTGAVAIVVTSNQLTQSAGKTALAEKTLGAERAKFEADRGKFDAERAKADLTEAKLKKEQAEETERQTNRRMADANEKLASAEARNAEAERAFVELQSKAGTAKSELARLQNAIDQIKNPPMDGSKELVPHSEATRLFLIPFLQSLFAADTDNPRLFIFVLDAAQKENARKLETPLKKVGVSIGSIIVFSGKREDTAVLRYFRDVDRAEAEKLRDALLGLGISQIRVSRVNDPDSAGTGRKYQLWVRKENLRTAP